MKPLGIISGTIMLKEKGIFANLKEERVVTAFGSAQVLRSDKIAFIARHGSDPRCHILPHLINHAANLQALKDLGVKEVLGIHSTGSLKASLKPGMLVVPDDYIMMMPYATTIREEPIHLTPLLSLEVRQRLLTASRDCGIDTVNGGIYWQTAGPRLETPAEIAMMAQYAHIVGMTMASEAIVAQELGLSFGSLCSVDNFANGIGEAKLTLETILTHARENADAILMIATRYAE